MRHSAAFYFFAFNSQNNRSSLRSVLHCVGKKVQKNLNQSLLITYKTFRENPHASHFKAELLGPYLRYNYGVYSFKKLPKAEFRQMQRCPAAFYFAHIKHIIYETEEVFTRRYNLPGVLPDFIRIIRIFLKK